MNGGVWKDTNQPGGSRRPKAKNQRPAQIPTTEHVHDVSKDKDAPSQDDQDESLRAQLEFIDLKMQLQRWSFARSWRTARSSLSQTEDDISPWCCPQDIEHPAVSPGNAQLVDSDLVPLPGHEANAVSVSQAPLDRHLIGQYLDGCIKAAEAKIANATNKAVKEEAVKEIERLVERVVGEAGRLETQGVDIKEGEWGVLA